MTSTTTPAPRAPISIPARIALVAALALLVVAVIAGLLGGLVPVLVANGGTVADVGAASLVLGVVGAVRTLLAVVPLVLGLVALGRPGPAGRVEAGIAVGVSGTLLLLGAFGLLATPLLGLLMR